MNKYKRYLLAVLVGVCLGAVLYVIGLAKPRVNQNPPVQNHISAPEVVSCVRTIKVMSRKVRNAGTPTATVAIEVENTSDLGIVAISMESMKGKDRYTERANTFGADERTPVIKPHDTLILTMALSNVFPKVPLQIGSVMYTGGTEEGCESSLRAMRKSKEYHERLKAERKVHPNETNTSFFGLGGDQFVRNCKSTS